MQTRSRSLPATEFVIIATPLPSPPSLLWPFLLNAINREGYLYYFNRFLTPRKKIVRVCLLISFLTIFVNRAMLPLANKFGITTRTNRLSNRCCNNVAPLFDIFLISLMSEKNKLHKVAIYNLYLDYYILFAVAQFT